MAIMIVSSSDRGTRWCELMRRKGHTLYQFLMSGSSWNENPLDTGKRNSNQNPIKIKKGSSHPFLVGTEEKQSEN
jgi:hypothetical protein